jgi:beta-lactamase regulating signal transducer with metallopeptidase domain/peptidoglycan/xylan/chitin deacetylase (PgdA/CDA1 family)
MNWEILAGSKLIENLGWTLVHSIWQIALMAGALLFVLRIFKSFSASTRYLLSVSVLALAFTFPLTTFVFFSKNSAETSRAAAHQTENTDSIKSRIQPAEKFSAVGNDHSRIASVGTESNAFSFENLQVSFKQNLAAELPLFVLLWILGVSLYTLRLCGGFWQLHKYKTREIFEPDAEWQERFLRLCGKINVRQIIKLRQSNLVKTPMVIGWLKPLIIVPASVFLQMNPHELETILAHELVHIRRYDNLVNFLQSFVEIVFFYHPGARWISAVIRREREYACDDAVLEILDSRRIVYAEALANLEEIRLLTNEKTPSVIMAASGGKLMQRIERIIEKNTEKQANSKQSFWSASLALLLISAFLISVFSAQTALSVNSKTVVTENKKIAIGLVPLPPLDRLNPPHDSESTSRLLIEKLKAHKVPAIGFVSGGMIADASNEKLYPARSNIVRLWRDAGFEIGIGGFRHIWFYHTPYDDYVANVEKNERVTKQILAEKNLPLRWFSYPFLNTGKTAADAERFEKWLGGRGLRSVKYTFDNQEWMYSFAYDMARKDNDVNTMSEIRREFLDYMEKMLAHYEAYSQEMFGRDIAQTLVLTPSPLVAQTADELFGMFEKHGYRFVSMDEAMQDEAYQTKAAVVESQSGISWFERWQMEQNKKLRDEPRVSALIDKIWNEKKSGK